MFPYTHRCSSAVLGVWKSSQGFGPILFKQVPYTMAKFAVQGKAAEIMYDTMGTSPETMSNLGNTFYDSTS